MPHAMQSGIGRGFSHPGLESQRVFRGCLEALSRPGRAANIASDLPEIGTLSPACVGILLTLVDVDTSVWLDQAARRDPAIANYLRFHTGARICEAAADADFALVIEPDAMPSLDAFKQGTPDYPDASTTLILQVGRFEANGPVFTGPGIDGAIRFWANPLPADLAEQLAENRSRFPCGVDILFVAGTQVCGVPRSAKISAVGAV